MLPGLICGGVCFLAAGIFLLWVRWPASLLHVGGVLCLYLQTGSPSADKSALRGQLCTLCCRRVVWVTKQPATDKVRCGAPQLSLQRQPPSVLGAASCPGLGGAREALVSAAVPAP